MADSTVTSKRLLKGRVGELDGIRGLAALMVVLCHLPIAFWFGETGVDLFFVLSGYLITGIILRNREGEHFFGTFFTRRALRIWPIYYLTIAMFVVVSLLRRHPDSMKGLPWYLFYLQNTWEYAGKLGAPIQTLWHTWTLAIEEQFYFLWPLLLYLFRSRFSFRVMAFVGLVLPFFLRMSGISNHTLLTHSEPLILGGMLAAYEWATPARDHNRDARWFGLVAIVGAIAYFLGWEAVHGLGGSGKDYIYSHTGVVFVSLLYLGIVGYLSSRAGSRELALLRHPGLVYLGQISYGLYLYHWVLWEWVDTYLKFHLGVQDTWWMSVGKVGASLAVAIASWEFIEKPILALKDRMRYGAHQRTLVEAEAQS